jgi:hypothetical protein
MGPGPKHLMMNQSRALVPKPCKPQPEHQQTDATQSASATSITTTQALYLVGSDIRAESARSDARYCNHFTSHAHIAQCIWCQRFACT